MIGRRLHIVLALFLLFSTTEYLWARHLVDQQDPCELLKKEIEEDTELKEKEGEKEERRKSCYPNASLYTSIQVLAKIPFTNLVYDHQLSAARKNADRKLFLLHHQLKLHS